MNIYIACSYGSSPTARRMAALLAEHGHTIVSRWHEEADRDTDPQDEAARAQLQAANEADMQRADALVVLSHVGQPRATYWEAGWCAALGLPTVWVHGADGHGRCLADSRPGVRRVVAYGVDAVDAAAIASELVDIGARELRMLGAV